MCIGDFHSTVESHPRCFENPSEMILKIADLQAYNVADRILSRENISGLGLNWLNLRKATESKRKADEIKRNQAQHKNPSIFLLAFDISSGIYAIWG